VLSILKMNPLHKLIILWWTLLHTLHIQAQTLDNACLYFPSTHLEKTGQWCVLLPGASGLSIFDDDSFYIRRAQMLNDKGYDVLLIDYKQYFKNKRDRNIHLPTTSEKIAWVVRHALQDAFTQGILNKDRGGFLIAWRLAGQGAFYLVQDSGWIDDVKLHAAAVYYPAHEEWNIINSQVPLLLFTGQDDQVTPANNMKEKIDQCKLIQWIQFPDAFHGFDVESLSPGRTMRFPPVIGKKYLFKYHAVARDESLKLLLGFFQQFR